MAYSPVLSDNVNFGYGPGTSNNVIPSNSGPFVFANALYMVLQNNTLAPAVTKAVEILRSNDGGATWTSLDSANEPVPGPMGPYPLSSVIFDGQHTVTVAFGTANATPTPIKLQDFNLITQTWGPIYGTVGAPLAGTLLQLVKRANGDLVLFSVRSGTFQSSVFTGGVWLAPFDATVNEQPGSAFNGTTFVTVDSTGRIHLFFESTNFPDTFLNYQQITTDNTLGPFQAGILESPGSYTAAYAPQPIIVGDTLVLGLLFPGGDHGSFPGLLIGSSLAAPSFTVSGTIDATQPSNPASPPYLFTDGHTIAAVYIVADAAADAAGAARLLSTTNLAHPALGWTGSTVFDMSLDSPAGFYNGAGQELTFPTVYVFNGQLLISYDAFSADPGAGGVVARFWSGSFTPNAPARYFAGQPLSGISLTFYCQKRRDVAKKSGCNN